MFFSVFWCSKKIIQETRFLKKSTNKIKKNNNFYNNFYDISVLCFGSIFLNFEFTGEFITKAWYIDIMFN